MKWLLIIIHIGGADTAAHVETRDFPGPAACERALMGGAFIAGAGVSLIAFCAQEVVA